MSLMFYVNKILAAADELDRDAIKQIARRTDIVTFSILAVIAVVFVVLVVYLVYFQKKYSRPKRSAERFKNFAAADATITSIEETTYYVKPYDPYNKTTLDVSGKGKDKALEKKPLHDKEAREKKPEVEKQRYNVRYEFSVGGDDNLYSGEFPCYEQNDDVKVGRKIEVKYNPDNPMVSYTAYNAPLGM